MLQVIRKIGNSQGILLPRTVLQQAGIEGAVDIEITEGALILRAVKKHPRDGWEQVFDEAIKAGDQPEGDLFDGTPNQFDQTEWTW
ncbi:AbrB/MazE/SpoVT family DNA-binding domain-containing protein [Larkinella punicea]|uniref:AbrB/MazE/SpoVT family DNA-binding domain-containing protein n=1 Tax=Larkinella punicea TaxID=2315727 RepID=A0A368JI92_9BACT|nr:AbrB/MazE/SpoVT family DNA-binding domain-containing protein [Larkinella punicea]RCR66766.1 AbrB/MazE/SpoVT family DNA-binding domain-containing protein [Larkinella punicea]